MTASHHEPLEVIDVQDGHRMLEARHLIALSFTHALSLFAMTEGEDRTDE